jgi:hypothetical protein
MGFMALFLLGSEAFAQTTGALRGTVNDGDGLPIPSVTVTLSSDQLIGGKQERVTDPEGRFLFVELPPGVYEVISQKAGFQTISLTGIQINVNRTSNQTIVMNAGEEAEVFDVVAKRSAVDVENTTTGQILTKEFLERIPAGRSYQSAVQMASGVQTGSGGNPNMAGGATNENTYMLDGATITDPVTGTFSVNFNYDAIQQIEVLLGGYEPEYGISLGGVVNLVTESGTNNFEFDTLVYYENGDWRPRMDGRFTADGLDLMPTGFDSTSSLLTVSAKISGPLVRDRAWFIISYQLARSLIANTGIPQRRDYEGHYILTKLTVQPNAEHRLTAFIQMDPTTIDNTDQGDPFQKAEAQGRQVQGGFVAQGRWQWFLSPDANLDTMLVVQKTFIEVNAVPCTHNRDKDLHPCRPGEEEGHVDWETPGRLGLYGAYNSVNYGYFYFDDRIRYSATSKLQLLSVEDPLGGTHDFKIGVGVDQTVWDQIQGYSGNSAYYDLNVAGYDPQTFENYYWLEITGPIKFRTTGSVWNFFVQDAWKPVKNLTIKYGVRYDNSTMRNDLGEVVIEGNLWGPRLYGAWDPFGKGKSKIAGGYGRFNDTGRLGVASFTSAANYGSKLFLGELFDDFNGVGFLNNQEFMYDYGPSVNLNQAHETIRMPRSDEFVLLLQQQLIEDVALGANITAKYTRYLFEYDELNVIYDEDGSQIIGSRYADPFTNRYRMRTPELAKRDYYQADVYIDKVPSRRWSGRVTYSYIMNIGSSSQSTSGSFRNDPQTQYNYGPLFTNLTHSIKAYGYWDLPTDPWRQTIGFFMQYNSGEPLDRYYYSDAEGGYSLRIRDRGYYYHFNPWWEFNVMFQQAIDVRKGNLSLRVELHNAFNNRSPWSLSSSFLATDNRLITFSRQDPMRVILGIGYEF